MDNVHPPQRAKQKSSLFSWALHGSITILIGKIGHCCLEHFGNRPSKKKQGDQSLGLIPIFDGSEWRFNQF
jgi:hypothetical protein